MKSGLASLAAFRSAQARWLWLGSLGVTVVLYYWLLWLRSDVFDPEGVAIFWRLFILDDYWAALIMVPVIMLAVAPPVQAAALVVASWIGDHPRVIAVVTFVVLAFGARLVYHAHPLSMDEYSPWLQSYAFAAGRLTGQIPPQLVDWVVPAGFQGYFINVSHETGRIASAYWPGFALLLTPFSALGIPWLLNPVLGGAVVLLVYSVTRRLSASSEAAGLAVLLTLASQAFTINAISFYSMNAHLLLNLVFARLLMDLTASRAFAAGAVGSLALVLHNPVPHLLFAAPWLIWLFMVLGDRRAGIAMLCGYLPLCLTLGLGWSVLSTHWFGGEMLVRDNQDFVVYWLAKLDHVFRLPGKAILYARLAGIAKIWLWAAPGMLILAVWGAWKHRRDSFVLLLALSALSTLAGFLFVPFDQGHGWGFRYFQSAWGVLPVLAALASGSREDEVDGCSNSGLIDVRKLGAAFALLWLVVGGVLRMAQVNAFVSGHLAQLPAPDYGPAPVRIVNPANGYYAFDLVQNDPFLRGSLIFSTHGRERDAAMMQANFPGLVCVLSLYRGQVWDLPVKKKEPLG